LRKVWVAACGLIAQGEGPVFPDEVSFRVSGGKGREPNVGSAYTATGVRERMPKTLWACAEGRRKAPPLPPKRAGQRGDVGPHPQRLGRGTHGFW
jgi:hypothetical protein